MTILIKETEYNASGHGARKFVLSIQSKQINRFERERVLIGENHLLETIKYYLQITNEVHCEKTKTERTDQKGS